MHLENQSASSDGEFRIIAAQNIHRPTTWKTGNLVPGADRQQRMATITDRNTNGVWVRSADYSFTADNDYNQLWIYPYTTSSNQYDFYVDWIYVCLDNCAGSRYYNQGVIPAGEPKLGTIFIGSSYGGSGTVTVSPTAQTIMIAANEINIKEEFSAIVTTGSFLAKIEPCASPPTLLYTDEEVRNENSILPVEIPGEIDGSPEYDSGYVQKKSFGRNEISEVENKEQFVVYPNPTHNKVNIDFYSEKEEKLKIRILNNVGTVVREIVSASIAMGIKHIDLNIESLPSGSYLIQIINDKGKAAVKKIQKLN